MDNFLLVANSIQALGNLKQNLSKEYDMKDLEEVKIIIGWQITRDLFIKTIRVSSSPYIRDLLKEENFTNCNALTTLMKASSFIKINKSDDYDKANLGDYQRLIEKLI